MRTSLVCVAEQAKLGRNIKIYVSFWWCCIVLRCVINIASLKCL